jgi:hypothetical protein
MAEIKFSEAEKKAYRAVYAPTGTTDEQWEVFISECQRRALIPGTHVVMQLRTTNEWDSTLRQRIPVKRVVFITTINALRLIAERNGKYRGHNAFLYYYPDDENGSIVTRIPGLDEKTGRMIAQRVHAVSGEFLREGWNPQFVVARLDAYAQKKDDGTLTAVWANRTPEQLAKCLEALGLRTVAPEECGGLYIREEIPDEEVETSTPIVQAPVTPPPSAVKIPTGNSLPASAPENVQTNPIPEQLSAVGNISGPDPKESVPEIAQTAAEKAEPAQQPMTVVSAPEKPAAPMAVAAQASIGDAPATQKEREVFLGRAAKILRDVLSKLQPPLKNDKDLIKAYFLRKVGVDKLSAISALKWEELLQTLEKAGSPEAVAEIIKETK